MTWTKIATISVTQDWQYTPVILPTLGYVRFKFATVGAPCWIAQADNSDPDNVMFWDERRFLTAPYSRVLGFQSPAFFQQRVLAIRAPIFTSSWNVDVEVSSVPFEEYGNAAPVNLQPIVSQLNQIKNDTSTVSVNGGDIYAWAEEGSGKIDLIRQTLTELKPKIEDTAFLVGTFEGTTFGDLFIEIDAGKTAILSGQSEMKAKLDTIINLLSD